MKACSERFYHHLTTIHISLNNLSSKFTPKSVDVTDMSITKQLRLVFFNFFTIPRLLQVNAFVTVSQFQPNFIFAIKYGDKQS